MDMQNAGFSVHRLTNGGIDYGFYRAEAASLRKQAWQRFWQDIGCRSAAGLSAMSVGLSDLASGSTIFRAGR
jgi:hypothetical protein